MLKYMALYQQIKQSILSSEYPEGSFLPTEPELMQRYNVSRTTLRRAINLLREDRLIEVTQGRGTQVLPRNTLASAYVFSALEGNASVCSEIEANDETISTDAAAIDIVSASPEIADALATTPGTQVYRLQRLKFAGATAFSHVTSYVVAANFPGLETHNSEIHYLYRFLYENYGTRFTSSRTTISAASADFIEARMLGIELGSALNVLRRTTFSGEHPIEYSTSTSRPDYFSVIVTMAPERPQDGGFLRMSF